ncbi:hypothetical protein [Rhizobium sp. IBUN]|uniref:hypothetical protein n=1 Tax=Rhizobium sp. IBUN TaxID=1042326 RepID=UPI00040EDD14|nr:hypothetical protein [Rhizobium sp. IBUN]
METAAETISDHTAAVRLRSAAYAELTSARDALTEADGRLRCAVRDIDLDTGRDPVLSASMRGREAIARIRLEEARERLREAKRDLQRARDLSASFTAKEFELEHLD